MGPKNSLIKFVSPSVSDTPSLATFHLMATSWVGSNPSPNQQATNNNATNRNGRARSEYCLVAVNNFRHPLFSLFATVHHIWVLELSP